MSARHLVAVVVAAAALLTACTSDPTGLPPPSSTSSTEPRSTTTRPDFSTQTLATVAGQTTTTLRQSGGAVLQGIVDSAEGPVPGATVRVERLVADAVQRVDVLTNEDGTWELAGVPGGRYRVRAFRSPDLAMPTGDVRYVADDERVELRFTLQPYSGLEVRRGVTPSTPITGRPVNLAIRLTERLVDAEGVGRSTPLAGIDIEVQAAGWEPADPEVSPVASTDGDGRAVFEFRCQGVGPVTVTAIIGVERQTVPIEVPGCAPVPTTTTTTTTTTPPSTTTTTG